MIIFAIAALVAFGGYLITIPRLIYDEWSFWRAQKAEQPATPSGEEQRDIPRYAHGNL